MVSRSWSSGNTAYEYDLQGNLLAATGTEGRTAFSYNAFNQQTAVAMPNGNRLESRYHAEYLRAGTTQNGSVTSFLYYNGELLAESSPDGDTISRYILGYGVAAGWNREKEGYNPYHLDEQNSTAYITEINGEIENHYQYDAFGVVQTHQEEIHNRILYTGQQYDQSSGQYYLRARYYNPVVGRFLQEDVYRGDGLNLYAYCKNNPVVYYDPSGFTTWDDYRKSIAGQGLTQSQIQEEYHKIYGTSTQKKIFVNREGKVFRFGDPRFRPSYDPKQVINTWNENKNSDGNVYSSPSGDVIDWKEGDSRIDIWDMGHKKGSEYILMYDRYMREEYDPNDFENNETLFLEDYRKSKNYYPQTPHDNRKDNQVHSSLTLEEMERRGIRRIDESELENLDGDKCSRRK